MDWRRIQIFNEIAKFSSFTDASKKIKKSQSTLSRDIIHLEKKNEDDLRYTLLQVTDEGKKLLIIAKEFNSKLLSF